MFWVIIGFWGSIIGLFTWDMLRQWNSNPNAPLHLIFIGIHLVPAILYLIFAWDSYRWDIPNRWFYFFWGKWFDPGGVESTAPYLSTRRKIIGELKNRKNLPY